MCECVSVCMCAGVMRCVCYFCYHKLLINYFIITNSLKIYDNHFQLNKTIFVTFYDIH